MSTLYQTLSQELADHIEQGVFRPGDRMPGLRAISQQRKVSVATAVAAYRDLEDAGYLEARDRSGYYVRLRQKLSLALPARSNPVQRPVPVNRVDEILQMLQATAEPGIISMAGAIPEADWLPQVALEKATIKAIRQQRVSANQYQFPPGLPELRHQIARRLAQSGCRVVPEQIHITNGGQEALWLALKALTQPGDVVAIESPCFYGLLAILESLGLKALEIPTHPEQGIALDALQLALEKWPIKACVVVPSFSNPLGHCMADRDKKKLVQLLRQHQVTLVEDDIYGDLPHRGERPLPAKYWDKKDQNFLCSSFSKTLSPGLRVGWVVAPRHDVAVDREKMVLNTAHASLPQMVAAEILQGGTYERHLKQMRLRAARAVARMTQLIEQSFPAGTCMTSPVGSYVIWVELPEGYDTRHLAQQALNAGVSIAPGHLFTTSDKFNRCLRLNCAIKEAQMEQGVLRLAKLV